MDERLHTDGRPEFTSSAPRRQLAGTLDVGGRQLVAKDLSLSQPPPWSQPSPNLRGGTRKAVQKQRRPQPHPVVPTFCYIFMWENEKRWEQCFSIRKEKDPPLGTPRLGPHPVKPLFSETIKRCPNPLEGWDHAFRGWDRSRASVDYRPPPRRWSFSLWRRTAGC